jgi:long-chain acyl-CoA synthetase
MFLKMMPMFIRTKINLPIRKQLGTNIKAWISGGSRLDPEITQAFHDLGLPLRQGYGLTETSPVAAVQEEFDPVLDSVGKPLEHMQIRIDQPDQGGIGEVWIKGPNVMLGYTDEQLTREVLENGWFKTGDLGKLDSSGKLILTGRSKRLIVTEAGKNVYPEDIEIRLERLVGVKEAGVVEVEMKPAAILALDFEEPVAAAVMSMDSMNRDMAVENARQVLREYNSNASGHNQIMRFAIVDELPRTPLGKIAIKTLPQIFETNEIT